MTTTITSGTFFYCSIVTNSVSLVLVGLLLLYNFFTKDTISKKKIAYRLIVSDLLTVFLLSAFFIIENVGILDTAGCQVINVITSFLRNCTSCVATCICHLLISIMNGRRPDVILLKRYLSFFILVPLLPTIIFAAAVAPNVLSEVEFGRKTCIYNKDDKGVIVTAVVLTVLIPGLLCVLCIAAYIHSRQKLKSMYKQGIISDRALDGIYNTTRVLYGYPLIFCFITIFTIIYYIDFTNEVLAIIFTTVSGLQGSFLFLAYIFLAKHPSQLINPRGSKTISRITEFFYPSNSNDGHELFDSTPTSSRTESLLDSGDSNSNISTLGSPQDLDRRYSSNFLYLNETLPTVGVEEDDDSIL